MVSKPSKCAWVTKTRTVTPLTYRPVPISSKKSVRCTKSCRAGKNPRLVPKNWKICRKMPVRISALWKKPSVRRLILFQPARTVSKPSYCVTASSCKPDDRHKKAGNRRLFCACFIAAGGSGQAGKTLRQIAERGHGRMSRLCRQWLVTHQPGGLQASAPGGIQLFFNVG